VRPPRPKTSRQDIASVPAPVGSRTISPSVALLSANTTRPMPDQKIAPAHIAHGSVLVYRVNASS
jgi:hypothetical protein